MRTLITLFASIFWCLTLSAQVSPSEEKDKTFYQDKERGWFWLEEPPPEQEPDKIGQQPNPETQPSLEKEMVALDYEWLKENFNQVMGAAINNPTDENVANFAYVQRLMLDMSSRFQSKMTDYMMGETQLDESARRPTAAFALNQFKGEVSVRIENTINTIDEKSQGLWFFYSSSCQYCVKMIPVINRFIEFYNVEVLAISLDGGVLPGMEKMNIVYDMEMEVANKMNVSVTPTTMLVLNDNSTEIVAEGLRTMSDLERRYIRAGRIAKLIDKETYQRTKSVYEQNIYNNEDGVLMVDKAKLNSDPSFLAEALKERLADVEVFGTQIVKPNIRN